MQLRRYQVQHVIPTLRGMPEFRILDTATNGVVAYCLNAYIAADVARALTAEAAHLELTRANEELEELYRAMQEY
jgi:hypothetical protein